MKYLIVSEKGKSLGLARRLEQEGHGVLMHIVAPASQKKGQGLASILRTPRPIMDSEGVYNLSAIEWLMSTARPDITLFDSPITHVMATRMQNAGYRVLGVNTEVFSSPVERTPLSVNAFFNGTRFMAPFTLTQHYYALFNDDLGPRTPMGMTAEFIDPIHNFAKLLQETVAPTLRKTTYHGPVTAYINLEGSISDYFAGFSTVDNLLFEALSGSISQLLVDCANGVDANHMTVAKNAVAVRATLPPFPYGNTQQTSSIFGLNEGNLKHFWPNDLAYAEDTYSTTGESNDLGYFTARGNSVQEAKKRVYRTLHNLESPHYRQYRTDIGAQRSELAHAQV